MCLALISILATYYYLSVAANIELSNDKAYCHDGVPTKRLEFNSREEVTRNSGYLDQHLKVFISYATYIFKF